MESRKIAYGILVYYWILIGLLNLNLPLILPQKAVSFLTAACIGWLYCNYTQLEDDIATARSRSPRLLTLLGDFSWDGVTDIRTISGTKYSLFYGNGINHNGYFERGDVAICVPADHVVDVGMNRMIVTDLKKGHLLPNIVHDDTRYTLTGNLPSQIFDFSINTELDTISNERDAAVSFGSIQWQLNQDILNAIADGGNLLASINPFMFMDPGTKENFPKAIKKAVDEYDGEE